MQFDLAVLVHVITVLVAKFIHTRESFRKITHEENFISALWVSDTKQDRMLEL
jgi:hypothetical protein